MAFEIGKVLGILKISRIAELLVEQSPGIKQRRLNSAVLISAEGIREDFVERFHNESILDGVGSRKGTRSGDRILDGSVPLGLLFFGLRQFADRQKVPVHHRFGEELVMTGDGYAELFDELVSEIAIMGLIEVQSNRVAVLFTTLLLPVLRALATAIPVVGSIVLGDLSGNDDVELHTDILAKLLGLSATEI
jgi:hypothetical protein